MAIQFSKYQKEIFEFAENGEGHAIVNAVAGSGKTFTLIETMKRVKGRCVFLAFNKSIQMELAKKVPPHVDAMTLHSLGLKLTKNLGRAKVDFKKIDKIMDNVGPLVLSDGLRTEEWKEIIQKRNQIKKLVSMAKSTLTDYTSNVEVAKMCDFYDIEYEPSILSLFKTVFEKSVNMKNMIDFDDMIYFPVVFKLNTLNYDWVFVDESQDLNRSQIELVLRIVKKPNGRIFCVGDPKQSIYGFRGADSEAMDRIKETLNATELPLSVCYRCPKSHIENVQEIVPYIEAAPNAIDGEIVSIKKEQFVDEIIKDNDSLVVSRVNAPLIGYALELISRGHKASVRGKDIGTNLINIIKRITSSKDNIDSFETKIESWRQKEISKLTKRDAPESTIQLVEDKANTILTVADDCKTPMEVVDKIDKLFSDDNIGKVLSTVHKAKGLEAENIYIVLPELLPLKRKNQKEWEIEQEMHIKYVALTRAKKKIVNVLSK